MQSKRFWDRMKHAYQRYDRMMEKQGFYVVLGVCVLVIIISAVYTFSLRRDVAVPIVPEGVQDVGGTQQAQSLEEALIASRSAAQPVVVPTEPPFSFVQPVSGVTIRFFSVEEPQYFETVKAWQVHGGIDLMTDYGQPVVASASGTVTDVCNSGDLGLYVEIAHSGDYATLYAGLSDASYVQPGDPVTQGQVIGHAGNGVLAEGADGPHLHFEVRKAGTAMDPLLLFMGIDSDNTI